MTESKRLKVGITGGIGAGKSIVARVFQTLGVPVYDADSRAKWLMQNDETLQKQVTDLFGAATYSHGQLNRQWLAQVVFNDPEKLDQLNALVHPAVGKDYEQWHQQQSSTYTLKEAALLFESGSYQSLDYVIGVAASESIRLQRVLKRDAHRNEKDVKDIMSRQWPEAKKMEKADFVIFNDGTELVIPQVLKVHRAIGLNQTAT